MASVHKENIIIDNFKIDKDNLQFNFEKLNIDTNKNNTAFITNITCNSPYIDLIKIPTLKVLIDKNNMTIPETNIFLPNSKLVLKTNILNYNNSELSFGVLINGFINSKDIKKIKIQPAVYPLKISYNGNSTIQNLNAQILSEQATIFDEPVLINLISKFEKNILKIEELSAINYNGELPKDFKSGIKGTRKVTVSGYIENIKDPTLKNLRVFIPQPINIRWHDTIAQIKGDLFLNGKLISPEIVGQLNVLTLFNNQIQLSLTNSILDFAKNVANINAPTIKFGDSSLSLTALIDTNVQKLINVKNINIKSKYLNTDTFLMYKDADFILNIPIKIEEGKFYSEKIVSSIFDSKINMTAFSSDIKLNGDELFLNNVTSEAYNGKLAGSLKFNLKNEQSGVYIKNIVDCFDKNMCTLETVFTIPENKKDYLIPVKVLLLGKTQIYLQRPHLIPMLPFLFAITIPSYA